MQQARTGKAPLGAVPFPLKSNRGDFLLEAGSAQHLSWCFPSQDGWLHTFAETTGAPADGWTHCKVQGGKRRGGPGKHSTQLGKEQLLGSDPYAANLQHRLPCFPVPPWHCSLLHDRGFFSPRGCLSVNLGLAKDKKLKFTEAAVCTQTQRMGWGQHQLPTPCPWPTSAGGKGGSGLHPAPNLWGG